MFHGRTLNNRINKIHERGLRLIYKNETFLSFDDFLKRKKSVSIDQKNLQAVAIEIYKTKNDLGPKIMKDIFHLIQKPYNLRNDLELIRRLKGRERDKFPCRFCKTYIGNVDLI